MESYTPERYTWFIKLMKFAVKIWEGPCLKKCLICFSWWSLLPFSLHSDSENMPSHSEMSFKSSSQNLSDCFSKPAFSWSWSLIFQKLNDDCQDHVWTLYIWTYFYVETTSKATLFIAASLTSHYGYKLLRNSHFISKLWRDYWIEGAT